MIGVLAGGAVGPSAIQATAQVSEASGINQLWLAEDYFLTGGISATAIALAATQSIRVGTGVVSALTRHPAQLAMEFATLGNVFPDRVTLGIGLGLPLWMRQMGYVPESPITAVKSTVMAVRRLLDGEVVTSSDGYTQLNEVALEYPCPSIEIHLGAMGPNMLKLSGTASDGTILSLLACPEYVAKARELIDPRPEHQITTFAIFSIDQDPLTARRSVRPRLAFSLKRGPSPLTDAAGISEELEEFLTDAGADRLVDDMPDRWVEKLTVSGDAKQCISAVSELLDAGTDTVVLFPQPGERAPTLIERAGREIMPAFSKPQDGIRRP